MLLVSKVQRSSKGIFETFQVLTFAIDRNFLKCFIHDAKHPVHNYCLI